MTVGGRGGGGGGGAMGASKGGSGAKSVSGLQAPNARQDAIREHMASNAPQFANGDKVQIPSGRQATVVGLTTANIAGREHAMYQVKFLSGNVGIWRPTDLWPVP